MLLVQFYVFFFGHVVSAKYLPVGILKRAWTCLIPTKRATRKAERQLFLEKEQFSHFVPGLSKGISLLLCGLQWSDIFRNEVSTIVQKAFKNSF